MRGTDVCSTVISTGGHNTAYRPCCYAADSIQEHFNTIPWPDTIACLLLLLLLLLGSLSFVVVAHHVTQQI